MDASAATLQSSRKDEFVALLGAIVPVLERHIQAAEDTLQAKPDGFQLAPLVPEPCSSTELLREIDLDFQGAGKSRDGVVQMVDSIFRHSMNTWSQGFLSKFYSGPDVIGVVSELVLAVLNTNVHVYDVSPVLTSVERYTAKALAALFGFTSPNAGGIVQPGGSIANLTSVIVARNSLFPETKIKGNKALRLVLFTSENGHYSLEKAAQACGLGSEAAWPVAADSKGRMDSEDLQRQISKARNAGYTPFFVNATAGTTVIGYYDDLPEIARICSQEKLWLHVDGSWGACIALSPRQRHRQHGIELADSVTVTPHKMLKVPLTCSFLLTNDLRKFMKSNTLRAGYLFHSDENPGTKVADNDTLYNHVADEQVLEQEEEFWDLADLTLQCGRKGEALKFAMSWAYYGTEYYAKRIDEAFDVALQSTKLIKDHSELFLISDSPPPNLQVCFQFSPQGVSWNSEQKTFVTTNIAKNLVQRGFHVDYAPGPDGMFLRAVVHLDTQLETMKHLLQVVLDLGHRITPPNKSR